MTPLTDAPTRRDADAFGAFFRREQADLVRLGLLLTGDRGAAEDLAQDALVEVYRRWSRFQGENGAARYARTCVVTRSRSYHRRRFTRERHAPTLAGSRAEPGRREDDLAVERAWLADAVAALPRRQREVVVLRYWLDLSESDIAVTLGVSVGTVKSSAARALGRLEAALGAFETPSPSKEIR